MSRISARRLRRARWTRAYWSKVTIGSSAAVVLMTRSASISAGSSRSNGTGLAAPPRGGGLGALEAAVGHQDPAGAERLEVLERQLAHLAGADDQHGLVGEGVEDLPGHVDGDAGDRQLALVHAGLLADLLADPERLLEDPVEDRADRLARDGRAVGVADLAEDLPLAQDQALQAGRDPEQVPDDPLVVIADQVPGEGLGRRSRGTRRGTSESVSASGIASGSPAA